jgi:UDP-glucuronate 4-epimerase
LRILLTGAAGFIGSHLGEKLLADGHAVVGLDNFDPYYSPARKRRNLRAALAHEAYRFIEGNFADAQLLDSLLTENAFEAVIHLAANAGVRPSLEDPQKYVRNNITGLVLLLEALKNRGPQRLVFASSSSVYGNTTPPPFREDAPCLQPQSPYGAGKRAGEFFCATYAQLHGIRTTALRFFTVYGPRQRPDMAIAKFARAILTGRPITLFGDGDTARDYTFVSDIVDGIVAALQTDVASYRVYNLGGDHSTSLRELVEELEKVCGRKAIVERLRLQPGDVERTSADLTRSRKELGYAPRIRPAEGLAAAVSWLREELQRERSEGETGGAA